MYLYNEIYTYITVQNLRIIIIYGPYDHMVRRIKTDMLFYHTYIENEK